MPKKPYKKPRLRVLNAREVHIFRHKELHGYLDELIADFCKQTGKRPSTSTILELMQWSNEQCTNPTGE